MKNVIPQITDPLGRNWIQPSRDSILIDDTHALMSELSFKLLAQYDASIPTGVYPGKTWKCQRDDGVFLLRWFEICDDPKFCTIHHREILIA